MNNDKRIAINIDAKLSGKSTQELKDYADQLSRIQAFSKGLDKGALKQIDSSTSSLNDSSTSLGKVEKLSKTAFSVVGITAFLRSAKSLVTTLGQLTDKSSAYTENLNLYQVAFEGATNEADAFISKLTEMYGLDESWLTRTVGTFKQLSNAMGLSVEQGSNLSTLMTQMAIDISSLYNTDVDRASTVLQSALAGQTRPIRSLTGADITQNTLQNTLDTMGIEKAVSELSFAEKRLLIIVSLTQQLNQVTNDFGKTIESPANQTRILSEQWQRLTRAVGNVFLPIIAKVLPYLNAILMVLTEIINMVASLLGFDIEEFDYGISGASDAFLDMEESINSAGESAKKLKSGLRGFDKLNVITTPTKGGSGGGAGGGIDPSIMKAFNSAFDEYNAKLKEVKMRATEIRDNIMEWLGFTKVINPLTGEISWKYKGIKTTLKNIWESWKDLNGVAKVFVGLGLYALISKLVKGAKNLLSVLGNSGLLKTITPLAKDFLTLYKNTGMFTKSIQESIKQNKNLVTGLNGVKTAISGVLIALGGIAILTDSIKSIKNDGAGVVNVLGVIAGAITTVIGVSTALIPILTALGVTFTTTWATATLGLSVLITAVVALVSSLASAEEKTNEYKKAMDDLTESADASYEAGLATIKNTQKLTKELENLVDVTGRVKEGEEDRVEYILEKVNEAYGTEYKLIDGKITKNGEEIKSNDELIKSIDEVMKKKRSEAFLNAYQDVYNEALKQQNQILKEAEKLSGTKGELSKKQRKELENLKKQYDTNSETIKKYEELEMAYYTENIEEMDKSNKKFYDDSETSYKKAFSGLEKTTKETKTKINSTFGNQTFSAKLTLDTNQATRNFNTFGNGIKNSGLGLNFTPIKYAPNYPGYAKGGLPPVGQLFVANEQGPELVGHIGGQSFVANQNQMMDLLDRKIGNAGGMNNATFIIQVGSKEVARTVLTDLQDMAKSNGKPITITG